MLAAIRDGKLAICMVKPQSIYYPIETMNNAKGEG
jgi:hypothetical protein